MNNQRSITTALWSILALACVLTGGAGCERTATVRTSGSTTVAGREITFSLDQTGDLKAEADGAIVSFGNHKVRVEKNRVLLDGKESGEIAVDAKKVEIVLFHSELTVTSDGKEIIEHKSLE